MGYAYSAVWSSVFTHMANLYQSSRDPLSTPVNSNLGIAYYISRGATPSKVNLGCPLYGDSFNNTEGPGTSFVRVGTLGALGEAGTWYYDSLSVPGFNATITEIRSESIVCDEIGSRWLYVVGSEHGQNWEFEFDWYHCQ